MNRTSKTQLKCVCNYFRLIKNSHLVTNNLFVYKKIKIKTTRRFTNNKPININKSLYSYNDLFVSFKSKKNTNFTTSINQIRIYSKINNNPNKLIIYIESIINVLGFIFIGIIICFLCLALLSFIIVIIYELYKRLKKS